MTNSALRAFTLESGLALEDLNGATTSFGANAETLDVKAALEEGDGTIVADNSEIISALRGVAILEEVEAPEGAEPTPVSVSLTSAVSSAPIGFIPQGAPPEELGVPQATDVPAVHADEPTSVETAAAQPSSQGENAQPGVQGEPAEADQSSSPRAARFK